jgi:tape measure domain-containing protein
MASNRILQMILKIAGDTTGASGALRAFNAEINDSIKKSQQALSGFGNLGKTLGAAGLALSVGISAPLLLAGKNSLQAAAQIESVSTSFETLTGSAGRASKLLAEVRDFATKTPFEFPDLARSTQRLLAFGVGADQVIPTLRSIGNAAASIGGGVAEVDRISLALGQITAKGKASTEELQQIGELGIPALKILADAAGKTTAEMSKLIERGLVPADLAVKALLAGFDKKFTGAMEKQAQTLQGVFSNLSEQITVTAGNIGTALAPAAKQFATEFAIPVLKEAERIAAGFAKLSPEMKNGILAVGTVAVVAPPVIFALGQITAAVTSLITAGKALLAVQWGAALTPIGRVAALLAGVGATAYGIYQINASTNQMEAAFESANETLSQLESRLQKHGADFSNLQRQYRSGALALDDYSAALIQMAKEIGNSKGIPAPVSLADYEASAKGAAGLTIQLGKTKEEAKKVVSETKLPEWANYTSETFANLVAQLNRIGSNDEGLKNIFREETFNRSKAGLKTLQDELYKFLTASETFGVKLPVVETSVNSLEASFVSLTAKIQAAGGEIGEQLGKEIESLQEATQKAIAGVRETQGSIVDSVTGEAIQIPTLEFERLSGILTQLNILSSQVGRNMAKVPEQIEVNWSKVKVPLLEVDNIMSTMGLKSTRQLRNELDQVTEALKRLYSLRGSGSVIPAEVNNDINRLEERRKQLSVDVGEASAKSSQQATRGLLEVSTVTSNVAQAISKLTFEGGKFGETMEKLGRTIGEGVFSRLIEQVITSTGLIDGLAGKLGGIFKNVPGFGAPIIKNALPGGASAAAQAASGAGTAGLPGSAAAAASAGISSTLSLVTGAVSAISGVIGNFQQATANKRLGQIEETGRGSLNQLVSLQETFNAYLPELRNIHDRLKEIRLVGVGTFPQPGYGAIRVDAGSTNGNFSALDWLDDIHDRLVDIITYGIPVIPKAPVIPTLAAAGATPLGSGGGGLTVRGEGLTLVGFSTVDEFMDQVVVQLQRRGVKVG